MKKLKITESSMTTKIIMSSISAKEEEPFTKVVTSFPGLRPLEPSKAPAFWDAVNYKIGTSFLNQPDHGEICSLQGNFEMNFDERSEVYDPAEGGTVPGFNPFDFLSTDENFDHRDGIRTTTMTMAVDGVVAGTL